ncbi:hypothetical protein ACVWXO_004534 [Bradyrhizobium sp. LM2.7]
MMRHGLILLIFCAAIAGCTVAPAQERRPIAWDGLGQIRTGPPSRSVVW